jgi:tellurite methyltransferase
MALVPMNPDSNLISVRDDDEVSLSPRKKNVTKEKSYWNSFYSKEFSLKIPSQFCVSTAMEAHLDRPIVEFGCGNGRDSIYLASQGFDVHACDLSKEAIDRNQNQSKIKTCLESAAHAGSLEFSVVDATNREQVESVIDRARSRSGGRANSNITVYSRFFLHSIDKDQEDLFLDALSSTLTVKDDAIYLEFRCQMDEGLPKEHGKGHYRRYVDTDALVERLQNRGLDTVYEVTGRGMAKYKNEDPFVSRIIARKH